MSVQVLRRAAEQIRNDHGGPISRHTREGIRWLPVADWLEWEADESERFQAQTLAPRQMVPRRALAVARAYLGEA